MENKLLWSKEFENTRIEQVIVEDEAVTFTFCDDSKITVSTYHDQSCCEHVYGDFSVMKYHSTELTGKNIEKIEIKAVTDMGFLLCIKTGYDSYTKVFIPCYNYQNGYYSDQLMLNIKDNDSSIEIDISEYVEDHIN